MNFKAMTAGENTFNAAEHDSSVPTVEFRVSSDPKLLRIIRAGISHLCELVGFSPEQRNQTTLAVDEACANIIKYAYGGDTGKQIIVTARLLGDGIQVVLRDFGRKANQNEIKSRDLDDIRPGGLGVHFIHSTMDSVNFDTSLEEGNQLTLTKYRSTDVRNRDK